MAEHTTNKSAAIVMRLFIMGLCILCMALHFPPAPMPENAPENQFSALRAVKHLEHFATVPHRAGTDANFAVRDYLVATLKSMGLDPQVSECTVLRGDRAASPQNVIARLKGTGNTRAFMFCAHYDSVPWGPGAADDGAGVATMLEACRAIVAGPPLKNDLIFLFTDGEEEGLLGAQSFLQNHPWAKDVGLMLNFEARGTRGLSYLFETSSKNGWLIPHIVKAVPYPVMSSLMYDVYRQMPNSSDYRIFRKQIPGANIGFIGNLPWYHSPNDNVANISRASLQHHGSYALGFAAYFANLDLTTVTTQPSAIYFNLLGPLVIVYGNYLSLPFAILTTLVFLGVGILGFAKRRLTVRGVALGFGLFGLTLVAVMAALALALAFAYSFRGTYLLYNGTWYVAACCFLTFAVISVMHAWSRTEVSAEALAFAAAVLWLALLFVTDRFMSGATFLFNWPLLFMLLVLGASFLMAQSWKLLVIQAAAVIPGILLVIPLIADFFTAVTVILAPVIMIFAVLLWGLLAPQADGVFPRGRLVPVFSFLLGLILLIAGIVQGGFSPAQPKMDCLSYACNVDSGKTSWLSTDNEMDEFTSAFFPSGSKRESISEFGYRDLCLTAAAPSASLPAPEVKVLNNTLVDDVRTLEVQILSARKAARVDIHCTNPVEDLVINGIDVGKRGAEFTVQYSIFPREGIKLVLKTKSTEPIKLSLVDYTYSLPDLPNLPAFPPHIISEPNTINLDRPFQSNTTMVLKSFAFDAPLPASS